MKKIIALALLVVSGLFAVPTFAQTVYQQDDRYTQRRDGYNRQRRDRRWRDNRNYGVYVVNEYRYIRVGRRVYKETYRSTYTRYGMLVSRVLISRERMRRYDNYNGRDYRNDGIRFNVFLRF